MKRFMKSGLACIAMCGLANSSQAETLALHWTGDVIARPNLADDAATRCENGLSPVVMQTSEPMKTPFSSGRIPIFHGYQSGSVIVRRGGDKSVVPPDELLSSVRDFAFPSAPTETDEPRVQAEVTLYGCLSQHSMSLESASISISGDIGLYTMKLDETLEELSETYGGSIGVWFRPQIQLAEFYGAGAEAAEEKRNRPDFSFPGRYSRNNLRASGEIDLRAEEIRWVFERKNGAARPLVGPFAFTMRLFVIPEGLDWAE